MTAKELDAKLNLQAGRPTLKSTIDASRARKEYWAGVKEAKRQGKPVVAAFGLLPREIWHAMGVPVLGMESLALQVAARQLSGRYCQVATEMGFASELCALHLSLLGIAGTSQRDAFVEDLLVEPDLIVGSTFACMSESKSFLVWKERLGRPCHVVDIPINASGPGVPGRTVAYVAEELKGLIAFLRSNGFEYDEAKLSQAVDCSRRTMELWTRIEECRKAVPAPMGAVDALLCIGNTLVSLLGTETCVTLFQSLLDEISSRVSCRRGLLDEERLRLYLVGIPPLYHLDLLDYPAKHGAVVVKSDLDFFGGCMMSPDLLDPGRPLESLALKQLSDIVNPCFDNKIENAVRTIREYRIDGVIGLNKRGCRNLPASLRLIKDAAWKGAHIPMAVFDLDGIDPREYNDALVKANVDSFMETLVTSRTGTGI